ncbi:hypothetical protein E1B28_003950 [Marasmius oreades]|uniref:Uncharacterized protein n=1 Tax=Marasmius oreades TaxID=181124 RepID=A0A9P8ABF0_9AGAR|nr:uncharacterized protein E1B28_003950 [Marasmius oreades]KAG7096521.1 hypothetical protein E1B28_003950 [Marasmius oreades]
MVHIPQHHRRQVDTSQPTGVGLTGAKTVDTSVGTGSTLALDSSAPTEAAGEKGPPTWVIATSTAAFTPPPTSTADPVSSSTAPSSATSSSQIPIGTVIGACVGALIGAIVIICCGVWLYKKADPKKQRRGPQRDAQGRPWNKLDETPDTWEGKSRGMEMSQQAPRPLDSEDHHNESIEKMFKKSSPSIRTEYTIKTDFDNHPPFNLNLDNHPFATYHPNLARELANAPVVEESPRPPFMNLERAQSGHTWDDDAGTAHDSFLSLNSAKRVSGAMSPSLDMAIPTPPATSYNIGHHWESAEVVDFDGQAAEIVQPPAPAVVPDDNFSHNPFMRTRRKSESNPFFNAQSYDGSRTPSIKGKKRELTPPTTSQNPFADENKRHVKVDSLSSVSSNDRAIQSLLAALDNTPGTSSDPRHPSVQSAISAYSAITEDDVTGEFPLPPGVAAK